jgi:hypothetical protein
LHFAGTRRVQVILVALPPVVVKTVQSMLFGDKHAGRTALKTFANCA